MTEHSQIIDPKFQSRLRQRYAADMAALVAMGFGVLAYGLEQETPYSAVLQLPMLLLMLLNGEALTITRPLRISVGPPLLSHPDPSSVAVCMGMGVKFYTRFAEDLILVARTFESRAVPKPESKIIKLPAAPSIEGAWLAQRARVNQMQREGREVRPITTYADFVEVSKQEEDPAQYE